MFSFSSDSINIFLLSVDDQFKHETVFQIYWATCNCLILGMLTALVKLPDITLKSVKHNNSSLHELKSYLGLKTLFIFNEKTGSFFDAIICTIFATGFLSLLAHFFPLLVKFFLVKFNTCCKRTPKSRDKQIEINANDQELRTCWLTENWIRKSSIKAKASEKWKN